MNSLAIGSIQLKNDISRFIASSPMLYISQGLLVTPDTEIPIDFQDIISTIYISLVDGVCVATKSGELTMVYLNGRIEPVGAFDDGILALEWSPEQELCIVITGNLNVILLSSEFEPITEFPLAIEGGIEFVSVGWGKKETQFHGKAGKEAAKETVQKGSLTSNDDFFPRISWRGDGDYFAISSIQYEKRVIKVFNREGELEHTSEDVPGLEQHLDWRPSGNLIASVQQSNKHQVVFFERNGLRHGEFELRDPGTVSLLKWNGDSSLLCIVFETEQGSIVQIWGMCNYHWYLKQSIQLPCKLKQLEWDAEEPLLLHLVDSNNIYKKLEFNVVIYQSSSTVGVVDGKKLQLTPFSKVNVPPPMSYSEITFDSPIRSISFCDEKVAVLLVCGAMELVGNVKGHSKDLHRLGRIHLPTEIRMFEWIAPNELIAVQTKGSVDVLVHIHFDNNGDVETNEINVPVGNLLVFNLFRNAKLGFQTTEGDVFELLRMEKSFVPLKICTFPSICPTVTSTLFQFANGDEYVWIGLNKRNKCFLNSYQLAQDITSLQVNDEFLIVTTLEHKLKFIPLRQEVNSHHEVKPGEGLERMRNVEQGSKIVTVAGINVVLQMPRGNLETIAPRPLVLSHIRSCLTKKEYRSAFLVCRRHRLDLNYLIDFDIEAFIADMKEVVKQIPEIDYLNLLISGLKDDDTTLEFKSKANTVLTSSGEQKVDESKLPAGIKRYVSETQRVDKVNRICELLRQAFVPPQNYIQPILTTFAKQKPPKLEEALELILDLRVKDAKLAEESLKYLIFLVDVETLYSTSLGMYDFGLTLLVAQQSQKDPREYLPFLKELNRLPEAERKYRVDDHLGRHQKALFHLRDHVNVSKGDLKVVLDYIKKHKLFNSALELYTFGTTDYFKVATLYAEYLVDQREYKLAGALFEQIGDMERALDSYTLGLEWKEAIHLAVLTEAKSVAEVLRDGLVESKRFNDAAQVCELAQDFKNAIHYYSEAKEYDQALFLSVKHKLPPTDVLNSLKVHASNVAQELNNKKALFLKEFTSLQKTRYEKLTGTFVIRQAVEDVEMLEDTASMATTRTGRTFITSRTGITGMTGVTNQTGKTARQRRKQAKKREQGKNPWFQDEYAMKYLQSQIKALNDDYAKYEKLIHTLIKVGFLQEANQVQQNLQEYDSVVRQKQNDIFESQPMVGMHYLVALSNLGLDVDISIKDGTVVQDKVVEPVVLGTLPTLL